MDIMNISETSFKTNIAFCKAKDIITLNETKKYTLISTDVLDHILTDDNLTSQSAKLWQFLYIRASINPKLEITISYKELSNYFRKSVRTIIRYISTLRSFGYVEIKNNYHNNAQTINTFYVRLPKQLVALICKKKNRAFKIENTKDDFIMSDRDSFVNKQYKEYPSKKENIKNHINNTALTEISTAADLTITESEKETIDTSKTNNSSITKLDLIYKKIPQSPSDISKWYSNLREESAIEATKEVLNSHYLSCDKFVTGGSVTNDRQIITKNNYLLNNNSHSNSFSYIHQNQRLDRNHKMFILNCFTDKNKRKISMLQRERIFTTLTKYGFQDKDSHELTEQIVFSVEQDALSDKPMNHAVNIALKLVRNKRWTVPCKMKKLFVA